VSSALIGARRIAAVTGSRRLNYLRYTAPQKKFLSDSAPVTLLRGGNQIGKTLALHVDILHSARGTHPFQKCRRPPLNIVVLSESWEQMGQAGGFMEKLWSLIPKGEIDPKTRYDPGRGITGKPPRLVFVSGPGKGSVISFGTYRQGARRAAGSTVHRVYLDEPPPGSVYQELVVRVLRFNGKVRIGFTPVLDMPDQRYLRQLVEAEEISEHNPWLTEANCWPVGNPAPWLPQSRIDRMARSLPEAVRAMRIEGSWDPVLTTQWLSNFDRAKHISITPPPMGAYLGIGIDHGTNAGKQAAVLFAAVDRNGIAPRVWFLDEYIGHGITGIEEDATGILEMLDRNRLKWRDIDAWIGDRPTGESRYLVRKSNGQLRKHLAYQSKAPLKDFPVIVVPKKYHGSVEHGLWRLNDVMGRADDDGTAHCHIHPNAARFIEFAERFAGDSADPLKDVGDAGRYILELAVRDLPSTHMLARY
jgi:phage terminase large subunit-like protein